MWLSQYFYVYLQVKKANNRETKSYAKYDSLPLPDSLFVYMLGN